MPVNVIEKSKLPVQPFSLVSEKRNHDLTATTDGLSKLSGCCSIVAVGCSNIIPPVDGYAKRNGDAIMIGCYASRKTWHLSCEDGKWVGVIGNCSQGDIIRYNIRFAHHYSTRLFRLLKK